MKESVSRNGRRTFKRKKIQHSVFILCFQEAKAIIAQRSGNPREFFKQKERAMTISVDTSPVSIHRSGKHFKTSPDLCSRAELEKHSRDSWKI